MNLYTHLNLTSLSGLNNSNDISKSSSNTSLSTSKEYLKLIPPLSDVEFDSLKQSIKEEGQVKSSLRVRLDGLLLSNQVNIPMIEKCRLHQRNSLLMRSTSAQSERTLSGG